MSRPRGKVTGGYVRRTISRPRGKVTGGYVRRTISRPRGKVTGGYVRRTISIPKRLDDELEAYLKSREGATLSAILTVAAEDFLQPKKNR